MTNFLSLISLIGVFSAAVNVLCASTPSTVLHILDLANM